MGGAPPIGWDCDELLMPSPASRAPANMGAPVPGSAGPLALGTVPDLTSTAPSSPHPARLGPAAARAGDRRRALGARSSAQACVITPADGLSTPTPARSEPQSPKSQREKNGDGGFRFRQRRPDQIALPGTKRPNGPDYGTNIGPW
jgi:hypothetical protein